MTGRPPPPADRLAATLGRLLGPEFPPALGLAVSGGGDSMAMLHMVAGWARPMGIALRVATVDHGLRPDSAAEAAMVADECAGLGLPHDILHWKWDGQGNLMAAAREARLRLLGEWRGDLRHIAVAHTEDDLAETFLMRLARGSGVDGLAAMDEARAMPGDWTLIRPMLAISRAELRHYLKTLRIPFVDDPTNDDPAYDRTRARAALAALAPLGIDGPGLAATARRLSRARTALARQAAEAAARLAPSDPPRVTEGDVLLDRDGFAALDIEIQLRLLAGALQLVVSDPYRPRLNPLEEALDRTLGGGVSTLHGGMIVPRGGTIYVFREPKAVEGLASPVGAPEPWDGRWRVDGPATDGVEIRALGPEGLAQVPDPDLGGAPRALSWSKPAVWQGDRLLACPALGYGSGYTVRHDSPLAPGPDGLSHLLLSR